MIQSRKQDRYLSLLGWWVLLVLILPPWVGKPSWAQDYLRCDRTKGGEACQASSSLSRSSMHYGRTAWDAPTSAGRVILPVDRSRVNPGLLKSAQGMESLFLDHLFQVMRQTVQKSDLDLESSASQIYRGMLDSRYADQISHGDRGMGIADQIITYYDSRMHSGIKKQRVFTQKQSALKEKP